MLTFWVKHSNGFPVKVNVEENVDVYDLIKAVKKELHPKLDNVSLGEINLCLSPTDTIAIPRNKLAAEMYTGQPHGFVNTYDSPIIVLASAGDAAAKQFDVDHKKVLEIRVIMGCRTYLEKFSDQFLDWHSRNGCGYVMSSTDAALLHFETCSAVQRSSDSVFDDWLVGNLKKRAPEVKPPTQGSFRGAFGTLSQFVHLIPLIRTTQSHRAIIPADIISPEEIRLLYRLLKTDGEEPVVLENGLIREPLENEKQSPGKQH